MTRDTIFGILGTKMETTSSVKLIVADRRTEEDRTADGLIRHRQPGDNTVLAVVVNQRGEIEFTHAVTCRRWNAAEMADMVYEVVRRWREKQEITS